MYRVYAEIPDIIGYKVQLMNDPPSATMPEGCIGLMIPQTTNPALNAPQIFKRASSCIGALIEKFKAGAVTDVQRAMFVEATGQMQVDTTNAGSDINVCAVVNLAAGLNEQTRSVVMEEGFEQILEVLRETANQGILSGIRP
jgi:hypothetical protein